MGRPRVASETYSHDYASYGTFFLKKFTPYGSSFLAGIFISAVPRFSAFIPRRCLRLYKFLQIRFEIRCQGFFEDSAETGSVCASSVRTIMAFVSFVGRVLFASLFILSAWHEFDEFGFDGGPVARSLAPKFKIFSRHVSSHAGFQVPPVEMKHAVAAAIAMKGIGSLLFIFGSSLGAYLLLLHQAIVTPILYDFYNYDADKEEFNQLFTKFTQNLALLGALLFFIGMKNSVSRRQLGKKPLKSKTL